MTPSERIEKLWQAAALVNEVAISLNAGKSRCPACDCERYASWPEAQQKQRLDAALTRIEQVSSWMKRAQ